MALAASALFALPAAAQVPLGVEFRISQVATDGDASRSARLPALAYNPQANEFLVVWEGDGLATDDELEIFAQRLSATGSELGGDFRVSTTGADADATRDASNPALAYNPQANEYLVVWEGDPLATDDEEIFAQRLSATGSELGGDFRVSTTGTDADATRDAAEPALAYNAQAGEYLVSWAGDPLATADEIEIFGRRLGVLPEPPPGPRRHHHAAPERPDSQARPLPRRGPPPRHNSALPAVRERRRSVPHRAGTTRPPGAWPLRQATPLQPSRATLHPLRADARQL